MARSMTVSLMAEAVRIKSRSAASLQARASSTQSEATTHRHPGWAAIKGSRNRAGQSLSTPMGFVPSTCWARMER